MEASGAWLGPSSSLVRTPPLHGEGFIGLLDALLRGDLACKSGQPVIRLPFPEELEGFKAWLKLQGKTERTIRKSLQYLERLRGELRAALSVDAVLQFLANEDSPTSGITTRRR